MARSELTAEDLLYCLEQMANDLEKQKETLRELDARIGDGDLGVTIELGFRSLREGLPALKGADCGAVLARSGMNFMKAASSTFGILLASCFMGAGKAVTGQKALSLAELAKAAEGAEQGVRTRGKAELGDKTMLDALAPAVQALKQAAQEGKPFPQALDALAKAAEDGMKATIPLKSKHGRAAWQGDKTVGVQDAGATAVAMMAESFAKHAGERLG